MYTTKNPTPGAPPVLQLGNYRTRYDRDAARAAREQAAAGLSGDFAAQASANPYGSAEFSPNFFQRIAENLFGDYSARDSFYQQQDQAAMEYVNQLLDAQRRQNFDSPAAQAARMRAAGQNPDLLGTEGVSESAEAVPDDTPPDGMQNEPNALPNAIESGIQAMIGEIMPVFNLSKSAESALSLISMITDVQGKSYENANKAINLLGQSQDAVLNFLANTWPSYAEGDVIPEGYKVGDVKKLSASEINALVSGMDTFSKRDKSFIKSMMGMMTYDKNGNVTTGLQQRVQELRTKRLQDAQSEVSIMSTPGFDEDVSKWAESFYNQIGKMTNQMTLAITKANIASSGFTADYYGYNQDGTSLGAASAAADFAQAGYESEYYNNLEGDEAAAAENAQNKLNKLQDQLDAIVEETFSTLISGINDGDMSPQAKMVLRQMVYQMRAEFNAKKLERAAKAAARGKAKGENTVGKQIKDLVDIGTSVLPKPSKS